MSRRRSPRLNQDETPIKIEEESNEQFSDTLCRKEQKPKNEIKKRQQQQKHPKQLYDQKHNQKQQQQSSPPTPPSSDPSHNCDNDDYLKHEDIPRSWPYDQNGNSSYNGSRRASIESTTTLASIISESSVFRSSNNSQINPSSNTSSLTSNTSINYNHDDNNAGSSLSRMANDEKSMQNRHDTDHHDIDRNDIDRNVVMDRNDVAMDQVIDNDDDNTRQELDNDKNKIVILAKAIFGLLNAKWVVGTAVMTFILFLGFFCICRLSYISDRCQYWIVKDSDLNSEYTNYVDAGSDVKYEHSDVIIRAAVAEQVRSLCAAEIQKRIQPENNEMARYQKYILDDVVAEIIKNEIHKAVEEKLYIYSQDRLNKADYALSSGGAKIISPLTSPTYEMWPTQWHQRIMAAITGHGITRGKPPITALQPETHVGQCWPFAGPKGQLAVLLSRRIYVTAITYDHVSKDIAMGVTSAPKEFEVWGFVDDVPEVIIDNSYPKQGHEPLLLKQTDDVIQEEKQEGIFGDHSAIPSDLNDTNDTSNPNDAANNPSESSSDEKNGDERDLKLGSSPNHLFLGKFTYDINGSTIQTFEALRYSKPIIAVLMKDN
nr:2355_t:CDS:2 [Entrophospora candida]